MYLTGFHLQIGNFLALKVVMRNERSNDTPDRSPFGRKERPATDHTPYAGAHSPPELANDHMLTYDSRGAASMQDISPGSRLKIYI